MKGHGLLHHHHYGEVPGRPEVSRATIQKSLWVALVLTLGYMVVEVIGGLLAHSVALLADAGHMLTDSGSIGLALLALWVARRPASVTRTFGFQRTEILAALLNAWSLWIIAVWVFVEAYRRFLHPSEVQGVLMLGVGSIGLLVNLATAWVLHRSARESLNAEGAFLHVLGDLLGSIAVVGAGLLIVAFGWIIADPIFGTVIGVLLLITSSRLIWRILHVLMEGTPSHLNLHRLCQRLEQEKGVTGVHDIHAWSITSGYEALSVHVTVDPALWSSHESILQRLRGIASREFGLTHITIQLEYSGAACTEDHHFAHPSGSSP